jgi:hypothetical protein
MKSTAKLALASLILALTFAATPQNAAADIVITKHIDVSSPSMQSSGSPAPISLTDLAAAIVSAIGSIL